MTRARSVALALLIGAGAVGCRKPTSTSTSTVDGTSGVDAGRAREFWLWFARRSDELATIKTGLEPIADTLSSELHKVHPQLMFELGTAGPTREMIVSADGVRTVFPAVTALVAAAPPLPGWKVIAFRPRKSLDSSIEVAGMKLEPRQMWFVAQPEPQHPSKIALTLFVKGLTPANETPVSGASMLVLDSVVGEYDAETSIGALEVKPVPASGVAGLRPLADLPAVVDSLKK